MNKPEPRYTSEQEIIDEIDKAHAKATVELKSAEKWEHQIKQMQLEDDPRLFYMIDELHEKIKQSRKRATRLLDIRCADLKAKLAEFKTPLLPQLDDGNHTIPRKISTQ